MVEYDCYDLILPIAGGERGIMYRRRGEERRCDSFVHLLMFEIGCAKRNDFGLI